MKTNNFVFNFLKIVAWIIFVGLCIEAGGLLINFILSFFKPELVQNPYPIKKFDLSNLFERSKWLFSIIFSLILFIAILKAFLFYLVIKLVTKIDLSKPFNAFASRQISLISYYTFSIGLVSFIVLQTTKKLNYDEYELDMIRQFYTDGQAFILMAAVIYIIAQIFKKGVDLQSENELTI